MQSFTNWSGSLTFTPHSIVSPRSQDELCEVIHKASSSNKKVRVVGAGHSSSPLVETNDILVSLDHFSGLKSFDKENNSAEVGTAMTVHDVNASLQKVGLALFNAGDVDVQRLAGAIATGTHGSGKTLQNLASLLFGATVVTATGDVMSFNENDSPEIIRALRVSLGSLGILTSMTLKVVPLFRLHRLELCTSIDDCMNNFDQLCGDNRNVDFYWYPRSDMAKIRILNEPGKGSPSFPFQFTVDAEDEGWIGEILPKKRTLKFDEMEYSLEAEAGMACFQEIRKRVKEVHRRDVAWRILYRTIAPDDFYLSPHYGRQSVTISLHHNAGLPYQQYFNDIEPIFIAHGGRPHWAKKHSMKAEALRKRYPEWDTFQNIRKKFDPQGVFLNDHLQEIFYPS
jgi:FAD/FMN-containing dehydrogenase